MKRKTRILIFFAACVFLIPASAAGEWFGDLYLGLHSSQADDTEIKVNGAAVKRVDDSDTGAIFGAKIGYWFEGLPWLGWAADGSFSALNFGDIDIGVGSVSALVMGRLQLLRSEQYPRGRLQPYAGFGPGIFYGGMSEFIATPPASVLEDSYFDLGMDARGGVTFLIEEDYGVFLEYGFRSFSPTFKSTAYGGGVISFEPKIDMHTFMLGTTFRW